MDYSYFIDRMTRLTPLRGAINTQVVSLVDTHLEVLGVQLMRTQAQVSQDSHHNPVLFYMPYYLFVGMTSELPEDPANAPCHCVCLYDAPLPIGYTTGTLHNNLIILQMENHAHAENLMLILNHAAFVLSDEMRYYRGLERLTDARCQRIELNEALELIIQLIINSAAIVDTHGTVLAASVTYPFRHEKLNAQLASGHIDPALLMALRTESVYDTLRTSYYTSTDLVWSLQSHFLIVPIRIRGLSVAYLIVQSTRTALHDSTIRLMEPAVKLLASILDRQIDGRNDRSLLHSLLFQELLRAEPVQASELRQRVDELRWQELPGMRLLCCRGNDDGDPAFSQLRSALPDSRWTVMRSSLLLLLYPHDEAQESSSGLAEQLARLGLRAGRSWPFDDLMALPYAWQQAEAALSRSHGALTDYSHVFPSHVVSVPPEQLSHFVHPAIWRLADYDQSHEGSLLQTLEAVLSGSEHLSEVAESLFVHRSTLFYRINRIREVGQVDLSNGEERLNLLLSLRLLQEHELID